MKNVEKSYFRHILTQPTLVYKICAVMPVYCKLFLFYYICREKRHISVADLPDMIYVVDPFTDSVNGFFRKFSFKSLKKS